MEECRHYKCTIYDHKEGKMTAERKRKERQAGRQTTGDWWLWWDKHTTSARQESRMDSHEGQDGLSFMPLSH